LLRKKKTCRGKKEGMIHLRKKAAEALVLLLLTSTASACIEIGGNILFGTNIISDICLRYSIENDYPPNGSIFGSTTIPLKCTFTSANFTMFSAVHANVTGAGASGYMETVDTTNGTKTFAFEFNENGVYQWICGAKFLNETRVYASSWYTLNISAASVNPIVGGGNCQTDSAYYAVLTAGEENTVLLNLTGLYSDGYVADKSASNIWVDGGASYTYGENTTSILVDTSTIKQFVVWIGSFGRTVNRSKSTAAPDSMKHLSIINFTQAAPSYNIDIYSEVSGERWNFSHSGAMNLDIYCMNYAVERLDLKKFGLNHLFIATKEIPYIFHGINNVSSTTRNDTMNRKYMPTSTKENIRLYFLPPGYSMCTFDFTLSDYTGDFQKQNSYLGIQTNVNNSIVTIWKERWQGLTVRNVQLQQNDYYKIFISSGSAMRDISWFIADCNLSSITVTVTQPEPGTATDYYYDAMLAFTGDYSTRQLGFIFNISNDTVGVSHFKVMVQNTSGVYDIYYSSLTGYSQGSYSYVLPDVETSYFVEGYAESTKYGPLKIKGIYTLYNGSIQYIHLPGMPEEILGVARQSIFNGLSMVLLTFGAFMFGAFYSGFGGLFVSFGGSLLYLFGFLNVPWSLILFLNVLAVMNYWVAERWR